MEVSFNSPFPPTHSSSCFLGIGLPQPDNRELQQGGANENCLAVLNNFYNDGVHWVRLNKYER